MRTIVSTKIQGNEFFVKKFEQVESGRLMVFLCPNKEDAYNFPTTESAVDAIQCFVNPFDRKFTIKSTK